MTRILIAAMVFTIAAAPLFAQLTIQKIAVSYNGLTLYGRSNLDSVVTAFQNLGVPIDTIIDRNLAGSDTIDYTPYSVLIWASGDPRIGIIPGEPTAQAGLSTKEIGEVEKFLVAGKPDCQKDFVIAGQNIAYEHGSVMPNGPLDSAFLHSYLHVKFIANAPDSGTYHNRIAGQQPEYWKFSDSLASASPDVVGPALQTQQVGPTVNETAYYYASHPLTPSDSGAGISFYDPSVNIVFYGFDWADPIVTKPVGNADTTSGITRVMAGAFAFFASHGINNCAESVASVAEPSFSIRSVIPNPARTQALVSFDLPVSGTVTIRVLDLLGRTVRIDFADIPFDAGVWTRTLDLTGIPSGVYTCEIFISTDLLGKYTLSENFIVQ